MRAETLPAPLLPLPVADPVRPARTRTDLGARVVAAFTAILLLLMPMTALVAIGTDGPSAVAAVGLAVAAIVGTPLIAAWMLHRFVRPLGPLARGMARLGAGDLTGTVDAQAGGEPRAVLQSMQEVRERLSTAVGQVRTASLYETMHSIRGSSQSIREIIGVIDGIAFQTNILALNAAVEAARAGEQGRGYVLQEGGLVIACAIYKD
jgi:methyl-accepting chemotaxis protein